MRWCEFPTVENAAYDYWVEPECEEQPEYWVSAEQQLSATVCAVHLLQLVDRFLRNAETDKLPQEVTIRKIKD
jgi:hypothetical protein